MPCFECRHIRVNGERCRALAMQDAPFCWFHRNIRRRPKKEGPEPILDLPTLEDAESIQLALSDVICSLAAGRINSKSAGTLLYGLQIAGSNLRKTQLHYSTSNLVTQTDTDDEVGQLAPVQASEYFFLEGEEPEDEDDDEEETDEDDE
jgi:hypothetical protein